LPCPISNGNGPCRQSYDRRPCISGEINGGCDIYQPGVAVLDAQPAPGCYLQNDIIGRVDLRLLPISKSGFFPGAIIYPLSSLIASSTFSMTL